MSELGPLIYSNQISESFTHALSSGEQGLRNAPLLLLRIIEEDHWRRRYVERLKKVVEFERFIDYVTADPLPGIGASVDILRRLCGDNLHARQALDDALIGKRGNPTGSNQHSERGNVMNHDIARKPEQSWQLRRLRRDHAALHEEVMGGKKTITAAAIEAGIFPRRVAINLQNPVSAAQSIVNNAGIEYATKLLAELRDLIGSTEAA